MARSLPWLVGAGALATYLLLPRRRSLRVTPIDTSTSAASTRIERWVWPVPRWNGRAPTVSSGYDSPRPGLPRHGGVDLMFERASGDPYPVGSTNGSKGYVMPDNVSALAASDGVVWSAGPSPRGFQVVVDHGTFATYYAHLEKLLVTPTERATAKQRVTAGEPLGIVGASPIDAEHLKHLHFELWRGAPGARVDPEPIMRGWEVIADPRTTLVARNAGFLYRPVGATGEPYPGWLRALKGKAGVYLIKEGGELVYVGSSTKQLYDTLTRHFQTVRHEAQEVPMT